MKIVTFKGGLGNQIFEYAFYLYLKKGTNDNVYGYYNKTWLKGHNGLEIQNVFDIELPKSAVFANLIAIIIRFINRFFKNTHFISSENSLKMGAVYFDGWWQNKMFYKEQNDWIKFKEFELDHINSRHIKEIQQSQSISIHIRRGDYITNQFVNKYGGVCTKEYYKEAIQIIHENFNAPKFYVFSDDMEWVKANLPLENAIYVSNNSGDKSYLDMYLMSHCKANIIANSSFSYWGAYLNRNCSKVIYPKKWFNNEEAAPEIFKPDWIGI